MLVTRDFAGTNVRRDVCYNCRKRKWSNFTIFVQTTFSDATCLFLAWKFRRRKPQRRFIRNSRIWIPCSCL